MCVINCTVINSCYVCRAPCKDSIVTTKVRAMHRTQQTTVKPALCITRPPPYNSQCLWSRPIAYRIMAMKCKRNELSLKRKVEVIEYLRKHHGSSSRTVAKDFDCGKTQIQSIIKNQGVILDEYERNGSENRERHRVTEFTEVNEALYKWYCFVGERNIPVSGPLLKEEALQIAKAIDPNTSFKASNGWLESFKKRHNIKQMTVSREWKERAKVLLSG